MYDVSLIMLSPVPRILSIIPRYLLSIGIWAAAPKGTKSCRSQGDFCSSVCPFVSPPQALSGLKSALSGLKSALLGLKSALSGLNFAFSGLKPVLSGLNLPSPIQGLRGQISGL